MIWLLCLTQFAHRWILTWGNEDDNTDRVRSPYRPGCPVYSASWVAAVGVNPRNWSCVSLPEDMIIYVLMGRGLGETTGGIFRYKRFIIHVEIQTGRPSQSALPPSLDANSYNRRGVRTVFPSVLGLKGLWGCWVWFVSRHAGKLYQELPFLGSRGSVLALATSLPRLDNRWFMVFNSRHEPKPFVFYCVWTGSGVHIA